MRGQNGNLSQGGSELMFGTRKPRVFSEQKQQELWFLAAQAEIEKSTKNGGFKKIAEALYKLPAGGDLQLELLNVHTASRIKRFRRQCIPVFGQEDLSIDDVIKTKVQDDYLGKDFSSQQEVEVWLNQNLQPNHFNLEPNQLSLIDRYLRLADDSKLEEKFMFGAGVIKQSNDSKLLCINKSTFTLALRMIKLDRDLPLHLTIPFDPDKCFDEVKQIPFYANKNFGSNWLALNKTERKKLEKALVEEIIAKDPRQALGKIRGIHNVYHYAKLLERAADLTNKDRLMESLPEFSNIPKQKLSRQALARAINITISRNKDPQTFGQTVLDCIQDESKSK